MGRSRTTNERRDELATAKLRRIRRGNSPRVLDLFSGCGGMTLGFESAGCEPVVGIELDPDAASSYALNFHDGLPDDLHRRHAEPKDITQGARWGPRKLLRYLGIEDPKMAIDIVIGGPPCPSFSRVGRAKLAFRWHPEKVDRATAHNADAYLEDERTNLYVRFIKYVAELAPAAIVMENVPEFLHHGGTNHGELASALLEALGYCCRYTLLNAAAYGVPQWRDRFFLVAIHKSAAVRDPPLFPPTTHSLEGMPIGYKGRRTHLRLADARLFGTTRYVDPPVPRGPPPISSEAAIGDLPSYRHFWNGEEVERESIDSSAGLVPYRVGRSPSKYAQYMRQWMANGHPAEGVLYHETRFLTRRTGRDVRLFREMEEGEEYPAVYERGTRLGEQAIRERERNEERAISQGSQEWEDLMSRHRPPYDPSKFSNKWWKLRSDRPSRTLTAHIGKDTYSHIHYDHDQARVITVQEAARLQSIPDGFQLSGQMNARYRQIGNSVPPLLAKAIATTLLDQLKRS